MVVSLARPWRGNRTLGNRCGAGKTNDKNEYAIGNLLDGNVVTENIKIDNFVIFEIAVSNATLVVQQDLTQTGYRP